MKTEFKSDLKKNYLVIEPEEEVNSEDYDVRMMEQNQIQGFLPMQVRRLDGSCYLYYEITSMQQTDLVYGKKQLQSRDIRHIFSEVKDILESARKYLLRPGQILFDPQYMYMGTEDKKIGVCYLPVKESSFSVLPLAEFILKKLNHEDSAAVSLGYDFYQKATQPNFSLSDTLSEILTGSYHKERRENGGGTDGYGEEGYWKENAGKDDGRKEEQERQRYREAEYAKAENDRKDREGREEKNTGTAACKNDCENDPFKVYHKERRSGEAKEKSGRKQSGIFQAVHPAILILTLLLSAVLGALLYVQLLGFTETGGLFFILLSVAILANRFWKSRKEKKEKDGRNKKSGRETKKQSWEREPFEEDPYLEEMQKLRAEMYGYEEEKKAQTAYTEKKEMQKSTEYTQYLDEMDETASLCLISEQPEKYPQILIRDRILIVGKKKGQADILLDEAAISRIHARLEYHQGNFYVMDLDSRNGTYLNGRRLPPRKQSEIRNGDRVAFANISYRVTTENESEMTQLLR